jgi:hypothetical protein
MAARVGVAMIVTCVRRCSGPDSRELMVEPAYQVWMPGTVLIMSCRGLDLSVRPALTALTPTSAVPSHRGDHGPPAATSGTALGSSYVRSVSIFGEPFGQARSGEMVRLVPDSRRRGGALWSSTRMDRLLGAQMCWLTPSSNPPGSEVHRDHEHSRRQPE